VNFPEMKKEEMSKMTKVILWYDPVDCLWSDNRTSTAIRVPDLDGQLHFDLLSRVEVSTDWGQAKHGLPSAVLQPGSASDIVKMVRFCRSLDIKIGARGHAHTQYGQSLVTGGLVVSMLSLNKIHSINSDFVSVDAGLTWRNLLSATLTRNLTPPVIPDYLALSVGGTLSVGGVSGTSYIHGTQADNILDLDVVTGEGNLITCSLTQHRDLFEAVLGGLGQCAIIVRASIRLIFAPTQARIFDMAYADIRTLLEDFKILLSDERFSYVEGIVQISPDGGFANILEGVYFYDNRPPDNAILLDGLSYIPDSVNVQQNSYLEFCDRVTIIESEKKSAGRWNLPHPGFDMFIPSQFAEDFISDILRKLKPDDVPDFPCFIYGFHRKKLVHPFPRTPDTETFFLFDVLRTTPLERVSQAVAENQQFYDIGRSIGARIYPISAVSLSENDWKYHWEPYDKQLQKAKSHYDPDGILTPGPGIFGNHST
jgi:cytokinin dehydrogenase